MAIDYERMMRVLSRCREVAEDAGVKPIVRTVHADRLSDAAARYAAAYDGLPVAESKNNKEAREAFESLAALDQPYREARAVYLAYFPDAVLPETLKARPTDTDKMSAVAHLQDLVDDHAGTPWADELLAGPFGQNAGVCIEEINQAIASNTELAAAREARAAAHGPAYAAYLAFKNVVRNSHGPKSVYYRRIHLRADGRMADEVVEAEEQPAPGAGEEVAAGE